MSADRIASEHGFERAVENVVRDMERALRWAMLGAAAVGALTALIVFLVLIGIVAAAGGDL